MKRVIEERLNGASFLKRPMFRTALVGKPSDAGTLIGWWTESTLDHRLCQAVGRIRTNRERRRSRYYVS